MRVAMYLRVSTGEQTTENQRLQLTEVIEQRKWDLVTVYEDAGISGAKGRNKRPALDRMLKAAVRGKFDLVATWSVDRLGRSLADLITIMTELQSTGVGLYIHQQAVDTNTPGGKAMYQMIGVFAEFERTMIQERVKAGLRRAKAEGKKLGRPVSIKENVKQKVLEYVAAGFPKEEIANRAGISRMSVYRIINEQGK